MQNIIDSEISLERHVRARQIALGRSLESKIAIYLDMNFWIIASDTSNGSRINSKEKELVRLMRDTAARGVAFYPISEGIFLELLKQRDIDSRRATARLIDELSLGVTLIPSNIRVGTELAHFIQSSDGTKGLHPLNHLVWSKLSYVLGYLHPHNTSFDAQTELSIQKRFFDHMWTISLTQMAEYLGDAKISADIKFDDLATRLNDGSAQHAYGLVSFTQALDAEIRGVVDIYGKIANDFVCNMAIKEGITPPQPGSTERTRGENQWKNCLIQALKKERTRKALATMYIEASLHASVRWDKKRKFKGNDLYDFGHATAAVAYCHAFFTEYPLRTMLLANHISLNKYFKCRVEAEVESATEFLRTLI